MVLACSCGLVATWIYTLRAASCNPVSQTTPWAYPAWGLFTLHGMQDMARSAKGITINHAEVAQPVRVFSPGLDCLWLGLLCCMTQGSGAYSIACSRALAEYRHKQRLGLTQAKHD